MNMLVPSRRAALLLSLLASIASAAPKATAPVVAAAPGELAIYTARPLASFHVSVADFESQAVLSGDSATVPKPDNAQVAASVVSVHVSGKDAGDDALTLHWKDAWYANLRIEGGTPVDLRPYLRQGVLALDLKVDNLAKGGMGFKLNCGKDCERKLPFLVEGRALAGKGWRHLVFPMRCFVREGDDFSAVPQPFALDGNGSGDVAIANVKLQTSGKPNASCPDYRTESVTPAMLDESWSIEWWLPRHQAKLKEIARRKAGKESTGVVFIGDSITEGWEKSGAKVWDANYKQFNGLALGFGGDRTENVLWRLQHGEVDGIDPKVAVLMLGTNNTGSRQENPLTTAAGIKRDIDELRKRLPHTRILLLAIFPRDEKPDGAARRRNQQVNAIVARLADNKRVFFLDINKVFLDADGVLSKSIMPDLLHPNQAGYALWAEAMAPELQRLMAMPRLPARPQ
ncbi:MAG: GDSL-type esterase/lipase family protein [Massilia sp.]